MYEKTLKKKLRVEETNFLFRFPCGVVPTVLVCFVFNVCLHYANDVVLVSNDSWLHLLK